MPYKNKSTKVYENTYYHVYSRGLNKSKVFLDEQDYKYFLHLLKKYLDPTYREIKIYQGEEISLPVNTVFGYVELNVYCLMPTHFHLLVYNLKPKGLSMLMTRVITGYVTYFNHKYSRQGNLFQGSYRSVTIQSEEQLIITGSYIHINPTVAGIVVNPSKYGYSSISNYISKKGNNWLKLNESILKLVDFKNILSFSKKINVDYKYLEESGLTL